MPVFKKVGQEMTSSLTLRDYFAAKALPEVISAMVKVGNSVSGTNAIEAAADIAYGYADAMLAERNKNVQR